MSRLCDIVIITHGVSLSLALFQVLFVLLQSLFINHHVYFLSSDDAGWCDDVNEASAGSSGASEWTAESSSSSASLVSDADFEVMPTEVRVASGTTAYLSCRPRSLRNKTVISSRRRPERAIYKCSRSRSTLHAAAVQFVSQCVYLRRRYIFIYPCKYIDVCDECERKYVMRMKIEGKVMRQPTHLVYNPSACLPALPACLPLLLAPIVRRTLCRLWGTFIISRRLI